MRIVFFVYTIRGFKKAIVFICTKFTMFVKKKWPSIIVIIVLGNVKYVIWNYSATNIFFTYYNFLF